MKAPAPRLFHAGVALGVLTGLHFNVRSPGPYIFDHLVRLIDDDDRKQEVPHPQKEGSCHTIVDHIGKPSVFPRDPGLLFGLSVAVAGP